MTTSLSRVSTWMSEARRCERVEQRGVHQLDDRRLIGGEAVDRERLFPGLVVLEDDLDPELLRRLFEHALRRLALLEDLLDRAGRADDDLDRGAEQELELVDHEHVGRIGDDDLQAGRGAIPRDEVVAEHQVDGDRAEELGVDLEVGEIDVLDADPLGEPPRLELLGEDFPAGLRVDQNARPPRLIPRRTSTIRPPGSAAGRTPAACRSRPAP